MRITAKQVAVAWYQILKTASKEEASEYSKNTLNALYREGHARWIPEILRLIDDYERADRDCVRVQVKSAHPIPEGVIMDFLREHIPAKEYEIKTTIEPSIIGGLQIETSEKRWNISLEEKLKQLYQSVSNAAS